MPLLEVHDLHKTYREGKVETPALRSFSLTVDEGEFIALMGPSGSGKTTALNIIGGLDTADSGKVILNGREITGLPRRELARIRLFDVGFIFQAYNLIPVLTALENVEYVMLVQGVEKSERRKKGLQMMEELGLADISDKMPDEMNSGQQQMIALARAIVSEPKLVLADEPVASLDSVTGGNLLGLMKKLSEERKITFVFSTHDSNSIKGAHRIITMKDGTAVGN